MRIRHSEFFRIIRAMTNGITGNTSHTGDISDDVEGDAQLLYR
jgi:hypothetical protein